jgi:hypothetical protein
MYIGTDHLLYKVNAMYIGTDHLLYKVNAMYIGTDHLLYKVNAHLNLRGSYVFSKEKLLCQLLWGKMT